MGPYIIFILKFKGQLLTTCPPLAKVSLGEGIICFTDSLEYIAILFRDLCAFIIFLEIEV